MNDVAGMTQEVPASAKARNILEAARALFIARGYEAASMDAVAKAANVSKATVYAYFNSKNELFTAIVARMADGLTREIGAVMEAGLPLDEALTAIGGRFLGVLTDPDRVRMFRMMVAEVDRFPELGRVFYRSGPLAMCDCLARYLEHATAAGLLAVPDPALAARQFLSLIKGDLHLRCLFNVGIVPAPSDRDRQVTAAVDMFLRAYGAPNVFRVQREAR
jgi:TetR/AcrR family transcriptional repressor of mexJK operon